MVEAGSFRTVDMNMATEAPRRAAASCTVVADPTMEIEDIFLFLRSLQPPGHQIREFPSGMIDILALTEKSSGYSEIIV